MSAVLRELKTNRTLQQEAVAKTLKLAEEAEYEYLIIVGINKDGNIRTLTSGMPSRFEILGALEFAKDEVLHPNV